MGKSDLTRPGTGSLIGSGSEAEPEVLEKYVVVLLIGVLVLMLMFLVLIFRVLVLTGVLVLH